jgi:hypothetical protein
VKWCCNYYNTIKTNKNKHYTRLFIQLKKFTLKHHLPTTLAKGDEEYEITRRNITGGS